ncbi:MAG: FkbM family methyltransferase [Brevundimonas sp.]|nr:MAG: FkbM family methyltransferase [Brevundimonas sp.]
MAEDTPHQAAIRRATDAIRALPPADDPEVRSEVRHAIKHLTTYRRAVPYLVCTGWLTSVELQRSVDGAGQPIPWYTYPAIAFLSSKDYGTLRVFEFGSGGSTIWWAARAKSVVSVEHDAAWAEEIRPQLPDSVDYHHEPLVPGGDYSRKAETLGGPYDIVIVDGRDRVNSALSSRSTLSPSGVIIWDNAERRRYTKGCEQLLASGFRRLDFHGMGPIAGNPTVTSIFYRPDNCLGI